jgi:glucose-1-phosphate thymidylyltransferase
LKGVILAGGKGTRLKPFTNVINKHLLPVGKFPMICWPISRLKEAGIKDILIVTNEEHLPQFFKIIGNGESLNVNIQYTIQKEPNGIGDGVRKAEFFTNGDPFVLLLGDNIFEMNLSSFLKSFEKSGNEAHLFLKEVDEPSRYGVAFLDKEKKEITDLVEKPTCSKSNLCITGIYLYKPVVFHVLNEIKPSLRGEYEITDVNRKFLEKGTIGFSYVEGFWSDAGTYESWVDANLFAFQQINSKV